MRRLASVLPMASGIIGFRGMLVGKKGQDTCVRATTSSLQQHTFQNNGQVRRLWVSVQKLKEEHVTCS